MFQPSTPYLRLSLLLGLAVPALCLFLFTEPTHTCGLEMLVAETVENPTIVEPPRTDLADETIPPAYTTIAGRKVYKVVEQMPLFPGKTCGDELDYRKRKGCSDRALLQYIYSHVRYPKKAREKGTQGMAVVRFVVEAHGRITNVEILRDPGDGLGKAAAKVVRRMRKDNLRWEPGLHKGKPVAVEYNLPIKFMLEG